MSNEKRTVVGELSVDVDTSSIDRALERVQMLIIAVLQLNEAIRGAESRIADAQPIAGELVAFEDPTPAKLDLLIAGQARTNELLEMLVEMGRAAARQMRRAADAIESVGLPKDGREPPTYDPVTGTVAYPTSTEAPVTPVSIV
jgi:hypothetical protein